MGPKVKKEPTDAPLDVIDDPSWLVTPPDDAVPMPPVSARAQMLPFEQLSWQNFERLCLRLAATDGEAEHWQLYGTAGQAQGGIDIFVRRRATPRYAVWQSKRHKSFGPSKIKEAIKVFLDGAWAAKSDRFVLCIQATLTSTDTADAVEECAAQLRAKGIEFVPMDGERLAQKLKKYPEIVDDFFGRAWVELYCGVEAAAELSARLRREDLLHLRSSLRTFYTSHFASVDPGVLAATAAIGGAPRRSLALLERFIPPDLLPQGESEPTRTAPGERTSSDSERDRAEQPLDETALNSRVPSGAADTLRELTRVPLGAWLSTTERSVVLGGAGSGKSTLLRVLALDLLTPEPRLLELARCWPGYLPVWVSFPFWTRLIAGGSPGDAQSLVGAVEAWFRMQGEAELVPLVHAALEDRRLLLLVDGLDEWANETAAGTALGMLQTFADRRGTPVILTSRPHGFRLMRGLDASWRIAELAQFTAAQQVELATAWFVHLERQVSEDRVGDADTVELRGRRRAEDFVSELQRSGGIAQLASIPLLLSGLIALKLTRARLPRSRFRAYAQLSELLLEIHPSSRNRAALAGNQEINASTRELALSHLAYAIQCSENEDVAPDAINIGAALEAVKKSLIDGVGMSQAEAHSKANGLLTLGEEAIGILVKKSPREIGFLHRAFQEFLVAKYLSGLDFDEQRSLVARRAGDPQWLDVILCLLSLSVRSKEVDSLLKAIDGGDAEHTNLIERATRELLLAEATFGDFRRSPEVANRLADRFFDGVEVGSWMPQRRAILAHAVDGLSSDVLSSRVRSKIREWFPKRHSHALCGAYDAMSDWPGDPAVVSTLLRGLHDDGLVVKRAAAQALAKICSNRLDAQERNKVQARLHAVLRNPPDADVAVVALEALWSGWDYDESIFDAITSAKRSANNFLVLAGIRGAVAFGIQLDSDLDWLLAASDDIQFRYGEWDDFLQETIAMGWCRDPRLKERVLAELNHWAGRGPGFFLLIGARAFPNDADVAEALAQFIRSRQPSGGVSLNHDLLPILADSFPGNSKIASALDELLATPRQRQDDVFLAQAAEVARTQAFKEALLNVLPQPQRISFWPAAALINVWGSEDPDVRNALIELAHAPPEKRQYVTHILPLVLDDREDCRRRLLEAVTSSENVRVDFTLQGLRLLGVDSRDVEAIDIVLESRDFLEERFLLENETRELIQTFTGAPRVDGIAIRHLERNGGVIDAVARVYRDNAEMRSAVLRAAAPLPTELRLYLADRLGERAMHDDWAHATLTLGQDDSDQRVMSAAAIGDARVLKNRNAIDSEYLEKWTDELRVIGARMGTRRQTALATLATVNRLDLFAFTKERESAESVSLGIFGLYFMHNPYLARALAEGWGQFESVLGGTDVALGRLQIQRRKFLDEFGPYLGLSESLKTAALAAIEAEAASGAFIPAGALRFLERERPASGLLRTLCLQSLDGRARDINDGEWSRFAASMTAAEILGRHFANDPPVVSELLARIEAQSDSAPPEGFVAVICEEGWSRFSFSQQVGESLLRSKSCGEFSVAVQMKLACAFSPPQEAANALSSACVQLTGSYWDGLSFWIPAVVRRLRADDELAENLMKRLSSGHAEPGEKCSYPKLLAAARGLSEDLRTWAFSELEAANMSGALAESGMDVVYGGFRFVSQSLADLVLQTMNGRV